MVGQAAAADHASPRALGDQRSDALIARLADATRYLITGVSPDTWFGPLQPLAPMAPPGVKGRQWDYPFGANLNYIPRAEDGASFAELRGLADALKRWLKNALDHVIHVCMNKPGLEFVWVGDDAVDPLEQAQTPQILVGAGIKTREEARGGSGARAGGRAGGKARGLTDPCASADAPPLQTQSQAFPRSRTKREHFLDRLRRSWHSHLQWEKWRRR